MVESECGAVAVGRTYLLPPLSSGGASLVRPWLRLHTPLIEPDVQISRIRLSDKTSRLHPRHVDNLMTYVTGDIPVGAYSATRLANTGLGHGAIDAGGGYTYFDPTKGHEFSAVLGFTDNFEN